MASKAELQGQLRALNMNMKKLETKYDNLGRSCSYYSRRCEILESILQATTKLRVPKGPPAQESFFQSFMDGYFAQNNEVSMADSFSDFLLNESRRNEAVMPNARRWSSHTVMFCFLIRSFGPKAYDYLRKVICLPCKETIMRHFAPVCANWRDCLLSEDGVKRICAMFRSLYNIDEDEKVDVVLGIDAMSMEPVSGSVIGADAGSNNVFLFYMMPLRTDYKSMPVHLMTRSKGNAGEDVFERLHAIICVLKSMKMNIRYVATDGDSGYMVFHQHTISKWWGIYRKQALDSVLAAEMGDEVFAVGDLLHILKNARSRLFSGPLTLSCDGSDFFTAERMNEILQLGPALTDRSSHAKMRDAFPLEIFTLENFMKLTDSKEWVMAFYVLPYALWATAVRNPGLSPQMRRDFLNIAFEIFAYYMENISNLAGSVSQNRVDGKLQFYCSNVQCTRILNTLFATLRELTSNPDNLALGHIGTHSLECQFGLVRLMCRNKHSWPKILSSFSRLMAIKASTRIFGPVSIRERVNVGGVKLTPESESATIYFPRPSSEIRNIYEYLHTPALLSGENLDESVKELAEAMKKDVSDFTDYVRSFLDECEARDLRAAPLWQGSSVSNNGILARLISFEGANRDEDHGQNNPPTGETGESQEIIYDNEAGTTYLNHVTP